MFLNSKECQNLVNLSCFVCGYLVWALCIFSFRLLSKIEKFMAPSRVASKHMEIQRTKFNENPLRKVLLAGSMEKLQYPLRAWAFADNDKRIVHLAHPGYSAGKSSEHIARPSDVNLLVSRIRNYNTNTLSASIKGGNFGLFASKFLACFTDMMRFNSLISKHFEFAAAGCLVLSSNQDLAVLKSVGFEHMKTFVAYNKTDPGKAISWVLDPNNRETVDRIRYAGYIAHSRHLSQNRSAFLDEHAQYVVAKAAGCPPLFHIYTI